MVEWPQERRNRSNNQVRFSQRITDIPSTLIHEVETTHAFSTLTQKLIDAFNEKAEPKAKLEELSLEVTQSHAFGDYDEIVHQVVIALAGVSVLRKVPTHEMWEYLWSLAYYSGSLAAFLPQAIIAAASEITFREQFIAIARDVVIEASENPGRRAIQQEKDLGKNLREHWKSHPQLSDLWRGNFHYFSIDRDDDNVLSIVAEIDLVEFVRLLDQYDSPAPVMHALMWCGTSWKFERWKTVALIAPASFNATAEWNGSLILPLLLAIAREQF